MDAVGRIIPCCGMTANETMKYGNVRDDFLKLKNRKETNIYQNNSYIKLRKSLLDGDLLEECKKCRIISEDDISTLELKIKFINYYQIHSLSARKLT